MVAYESVVICDTLLELPPPPVNGAPMNRLAFVLEDNSWWTVKGKKWVKVGELLPVVK